MKRLAGILAGYLAAAVIIAAVVGPVETAAQTTNDYSPYMGGAIEVPLVTIDDRSVELQRSLYPDYYLTHSSRSDIRWAAVNDSALTNFWQQNDTLILSTLSELAGMPWAESEFSIYLVRYYPGIGTSEPVIMPLGGIRRGGLVEAAPMDSRMTLNLIFQLSRRMLAQAVQPEHNYYHPIADHPLMQQTPYRRDLLAMLLALVTSQRVIGLDSTYAAYQSAFWQRHFPGREIFEQYLLKEWILSPERPLAQWIIEEPSSSKLVTVTRTPRRTRSTQETGPTKFIEGLPLKGELGFSVAYDASGRMYVDKIDPERLAYASGLREGDIIRSVNGERVRNQKDLIEKILATLETGGATLQVVREGQSETVLIQPMELAYPDEQLYWEEFQDSTYNDSIEMNEQMPDTTQPDTVEP
jgi:hypothetical protein